MDNTIGAAKTATHKVKKSSKRIVDLRRPRRAADLAGYQRRFAHEKFQWLERIAKDARNLPPLAPAVAILLCPLFNLDAQGTAWPSHE